MKPAPLLVLALLSQLVCSGLPADSDKDAVKPGLSIDGVMKLMNDAGYAETSLAIAAPDEAHGLTMWNVGEGALICTFKRKDKTVTAINYFFSDERPKSMRKEFDFEVKAYNPRSQEMQILVPKKAGRNVKEVPSSPF